MADRVPYREYPGFSWCQYSTEIMLAARQLSSDYPNRVCLNQCIMHAARKPFVAISMEHASGTTSVEILTSSNYDTSCKQLDYYTKTGSHDESAHHESTTIIKAGPGVNTKRSFPTFIRAGEGRKDRVCSEGKQTIRRRSWAKARLDNQPEINIIL
jgi:hypothetical protein